MSNDGIDFNKLNQEFNEAKEADLKYSRENDSKFRAVNQNVGSYEEFRDIVAASHLHPLEKDSMTKIKSTCKPWNTVLMQSNDKYQREIVLVQEKVDQSFTKCSSINTRDEFMKGWQNTENRVAYILSFDISFLCSIFKCDIPINFLAKTIEDLLSEISFCDNLQKAVDLLQAFTCSERFSLTIKFLDKKDKDNINKLFHVIEKCGTSTKELGSLYDI